MALTTEQLIRLELQRLRRYRSIASEADAATQTAKVHESINSLLDTWESEHRTTQSKVPS